MRRRTLLLGVAATFAATGCSSANGSTSTPVGGTAVPGGPDPVVRWVLTGGGLAAGQIALRPPRLAVYGNGEVIADAAYRSDLPAEDIAELIAQLSENLRGPAATKRRDDLPVIASASTTEFSVRSAHGTYNARAEALDELRQQEGYPTALYDARDRIGAVHQQVVASGQPYTARRVRLVIQVGPAQTDEILPWPATIELPAGAAQDEVRLADLDGQHARNVVRTVSRDLDLNGTWKAYRTASGMPLRASWRYLLPDE
ncbi:MAG: hypothetical protein HKP61_00270 [Dactylosporangium sp.]|nr:hypothetical protein [Dactylosporangium sp.]NNJ59407.1 hypothetical protein [Dactylosporangium sp.]